MDIGQPQREIIVEPIELPEPLREKPAVISQIHQGGINCKRTILWIDMVSPVDIVVLDEDVLPRLSIPERYRAGVVALATMPQHAFEDYLSAVEKGIDAENSPELEAQLAKKFASLRGRSDLSQVILATLSLQRVLKESHAPAKAFGKDIAEALPIDVPELGKSFDAKAAAERVRKIVEAKPVYLIEAKVRSLKSEVERAYCDGRILTDVRAVFGHDPSVAPTAMTILHTLRIGFHDDHAEHREFYVEMDSNDLAQLKRTIERAQTKGKTLETLLSKANCRLFE